MQSDRTTKLFLAVQEDKWDSKEVLGLADGILT